MLVSIIIPAYNAERTLDECLRACLAQTYPEFEVIVVDDGSTDSTAEIAQAIDGIIYVHQENGGPSKARNAGAAHAKGEIIAYTDSDCIAEPDWIEKLMSMFEDGVTAVGGTYGIANPESKLAQLVHNEIVYRHGQFEQEVDFLGSFNVAYRKKDFDEVGGFDEDFKIASGEDNDLAYRLHDTCGKLYFTREAVVNHYHPEKSWPYRRTQMRHGIWRMKIYAKHPKRSSGDKYAGPGAFAGPPLSLLLIAAPVLLLITVNVIQFSAFMVLYVAWSFLGYLYLKTNYAVLEAVSKNIGSWESVGVLISFLFFRDVARGLGLIKGVWHFIILRRETL